MWIKKQKNITKKNKLKKRGDKNYKKYKKLYNKI